MIISGSFSEWVPTCEILSLQLQAGLFRRSQLLLQSLCVLASCYALTQCCSLLFVTLRGGEGLFGGQPPGSFRIARLIVTVETEIPRSSSNVLQYSSSVRFGAAWSCSGSHALNAAALRAEGDRVSAWVGLSQSRVAA